MYPSGLFVSAASGGCSLSVSEQPTAKISTARANSPRPHLERFPRKTITTEPTRKQHRIQQRRGHHTHSVQAHATTTGVSHHHQTHHVRPGRVHHFIGHIPRRFGFAPFFSVVEAHS